jgi:hypothetical protein
MNNSALFQAFPGQWQAELLAVSTMYFLPPVSFRRRYARRSPWRIIAGGS